MERRPQPPRRPPRQLTPWQAASKAIRASVVREAEVSSEIELRRLTEEQKLLTARLAHVEGELTISPTPEASLPVHRTRGRAWLIWFFLILGAAVGTALWNLEWFSTLSWENKFLLAATLVALPVVGSKIFLTALTGRLDKKDSWKIHVVLGAVILTCSLTATPLLSGGRGAGTAFKEEQRQMEMIEGGDDLADSPTAAGPSRFEQATSTKRLLAKLGMLAVILLAIAGELAAGMAHYEYDRHMAIVRTAAPLYDERRRLQEYLTDIASEMEEWRRWPAWRAATLTTDGLQYEVDTARQEAQQQAEIERRKEEAEASRLQNEADITSQEAQQKAELARQEAEAEARRKAHENGEVGRLLKQTFGAIAIAFTVLFGAVWAYAAEVTTPGITVAVLDLSTSAGASDEFRYNRSAIQGVIRRIPVGGTRLMVIGVTEASFSASVLFSTSSPPVAGQFDEYRDQWRRASAQQWNRIASGLKPQAEGSDIFGALARASVEFDEVSTGPRRLIILSDMRQVGRGENFERSVGDPHQLTRKLEGMGLIPRLKHVDVWVLGVHTGGIDERHWARLKAFWLEYFKRAGASLKTFSPNRRLGETL